MRYAEFLKKDGVIGFVAPSFGCATEPYRSAFDSAKKEFARRGYILVTGPNCYESSGIGISSTPQRCGEELKYMYINSSSDILISCGGGELMCETLEYVDFDKIKNSPPKWYL